MQSEEAVLRFWPCGLTGLLVSDPEIGADGLWRLASIPSYFILIRSPTSPGMNSSFGTVGGVSVITLMGVGPFSLVETSSEVTSSGDTPKRLTPGLNSRVS